MPIAIGIRAFHRFVLSPVTEQTKHRVTAHLFFAGLFSRPREFEARVKTRPVICTGKH